MSALQNAVELSPERPGVQSFLGIAAVFQGRAHEALTEIQKEPEAVWRLYSLAIAHHALRDTKRADEALLELIAKFEAGSAYQIAGAHAYRGDTAQAFEWLNRAYTQRDGGLIDIKVDPLLNNLRGDPRYTDILKKMRLPIKRPENQRDRWSRHLFVERGCRERVRIGA